MQSEMELMRLSPAVYLQPIPESKELIESELENTHQYLLKTQSSTLPQPGKARELQLRIGQLKTALLNLDGYEKVLAAATELFHGDLNEAIEWLLQPNKSFGGNTPFEMAQEPGGEKWVLEEIGRIEHGVFS